jgi:hypothetical protein
MNFLSGKLRGFFTGKSERLRLGSTGIGSRPIPMVVGNSHFTGVKPLKMFPSVSRIGVRPRHSSVKRFPLNFAMSAGKSAMMSEAKPAGGRGGVEGAEAMPAAAKAQRPEDRMRADAMLSLALFLSSRRVPRV